ncbi:peroxide stress protein YaaA [Mycobacteroides salmoniphilum]|uniref:peroxide stress protein YaaA n=1 Tax=Mycobacteroides salmoniphilum TaxID=404941 RepID=UPI0010652CA2|nr:peroxide stress protein YaaA [Mycobacteroides salmoniphilum]
MIVLLPPSETKREGGDHPPLRLDELATPSLNPLREALVDELVSLAADLPACRKALGISASQDAEIQRNAELRVSPTMPALHRYTGVLYDALDVTSLRGASATRALERLAVGSALFGLLRADDPVPAYRLSASSKLPGKPSLSARWKPVLEPVLAELAANELIVDLRSGSYAGLGRLPHAVTVDCLTEHPDGRRTVITHFNKAHKGKLARILAGSRAEPTDAAAVAAVARRAGLHIERDGNALTIIVSQ